MRCSTNRLAAELNVHPNTLRSYERGERALDEETFVKACILLDVDVAEAFSAACLSGLISAPSYLSAPFQGSSVQRLKVFNRALPSES